MGVLTTELRSFVNRTFISLKANSLLRRIGCPIVAPALHEAAGHVVVFPEDGCSKRPVCVQGNEAIDGMSRAVMRSQR
ncbi:hypothetical protein BJF93_01545 [Xaviernesmea oryzae]|uniref:Uncharacterized protein n=1 Tax=Xaviernesmea oryzae TaxID=464029 RepID=A0A1Q9B2C7_9HYPH|nr:hypothetical protein BJF93_01545 [Xaviernesmea oryzae]